MFFTINLFRKLKLRYKFWVLTKLHAKRVASYSIVKQIALFANLLTEDAFKDYNPAQTGSATLLVPMHSLYDINNWLEEINGLLAAGMVLPKELIYIRHTYVRADHFLTNHDGYYSEPSEQVIKFKALVAKYAELVEPLTGQDSGVEGYNRRVTAPVTEVLRNLTYTLVQVDIN